jgi:hypothetical protein
MELGQPSGFLPERAFREYGPVRLVPVADTSRAAVPDLDDGVSLGLPSDLASR